MVTSQLTYDRFNLLTKDYSTEIIENNLDKACICLSDTARSLATSHQNPLRWPLDLEELYAELLCEIAKAIKIYYYCTPDYNEFITIGRKVLWNRLRELLARAYGTHRKNELTANVLSEEWDVFEVTGEELPIFLMDEFLNQLSPFARTVANLILDPDEKLQQAIKQHINARNKLYKIGAGVTGIPKKLLAEVLGVRSSKIQLAYNEIEKALTRSEEYMSTIHSIDLGLDFSKQLVTPNEYKVGEEKIPYIQWHIDKLIAQATFRGIYKEDMVRSVLVRVLNDYDKTHDIETVVYGKIVEEKKQEKSENKFIDATAVAETELPKPKLPTPVVSKQLKAESIDITSDTDLFKGLAEALRNGEQLIVTKLNESEYSIKIMQSSETKETHEYVNVKAEKVKIIENTFDEPVVGEEEEIIDTAGREVKEQRSGNIQTTLKYKKGSPEWNALVYTEEYIKFSIIVKALSNQEVYTKASALGVDWNRVDDPKINRMRAIDALRKHANVEKYRKEFESKEARDAITK